MIANSKESDSTLILCKLSNVEATNDFPEYVKSNLENSNVYYYSDSCAKDQNKILEFLDIKKINTIINMEAVSLVMDVNFLTKIKSNYEVKLICWHADIAEYFDTYLVYVSQFYDLQILDEWSEIQRYKNYGFNAKWFSHGYDLKYAKDPNSKRDIDVAFVGRMDRPGRKELFSKLSKTNLNVSIFGYGSKNGHISSEKMMELYSNSKIILNLTSISTVIPHFDRHRSINCLLSQVKGRIYEGGIAGAMILTEPASSLPFYGKSGESFVVFNSSDDLIKVIDFYIKNDKERLLIAKNGFEKSLKYGSYESQTEYLKLLIKQTSISRVGTIYLDSLYHKFVSRLIVDIYLRSFLGFKKPDFSILKGKRVDFLIYAFFRAFLLYPYKIYIRIKEN